MYEALPYRSVVAVDFEFEFGGHISFADASRSGERPRPVCLVARDLRTGRTWRLGPGRAPPAPALPDGRRRAVGAFRGGRGPLLFPRGGWGGAPQHSRPVPGVSRGQEGGADARRCRLGWCIDLFWT